MENAVVIAGAGPVGLMLACELAAAGVQTVVVERLAEPGGRSPGMAINAAVVELLAQRGLMDALQNDGLSWPSSHFAQLWLDPAGLSEPHETTFLVHQSRLELRLEERAKALGAELLRGREVVGVTEDGESVSVTLREGSTEEIVRAAYLVGCDGTNSAVRELAGIGFPGTAAPFHGIVGDIEVEPDDVLMQRMGVHQAPGGLFTVAPAGPNVLRVTTGEFGIEAEDPDAEPTWDEMKASVHRLVGLELTSGKPAWLGRWHNRTRLADRYRSGRVLLAGDAAHTHFPLGGQSLSTGIEDAVNLGWKLAAQLRGWAPDRLLDSYEAERRPVGERACRTTQAQVALMHPIDRIAPLREFFGELTKLPQLNEYLVKLAGGLDSRYPLPAADTEATALVGRRLGKVVVRVADSEEDGRLADVLTVERGLFLDPSGSDDYAAAVKPWGDRVDTVSAVVEPQPAAGAMLLRPDGRIVWTAPATAADDTIDTLREALATWFGAPN
jgi:2-polyprenyl-6-methoxyphenol hydroxylase-like FAD-dependent oxidoreductase